MPSRPILTLIYLTSCAFEDPAAIPESPKDPCQKDAAQPEVLYASYAKNPAINCETMTDSEGMDTVIYYTGRGWSLDGATCRAVDPFHGGLMISGSRPPVSEPLATTGSLAYCVVGPGSGTEYVVFSLCGILEPAKAGCELLGQMTGIPTEFETCPEGGLCP